MSYLVEAILKATDRGFSATMSGAAGSVRSLTAVTQGAQGILDKVFGSAGGFIKANIIMSSFNAVMGLVSGSVEGAVRRVDTMDRFPRMMDAIGFSAEQSEAAIQKLNAGVQGLPTSLDSVVATTQRLALMSGDLEQATNLTLALNNAFLASGSSTADAARGLVQFTQMLSKGSVDMMSWRTLQETMPYALTKTAEAFGYAGKSAQTDFYDALMSGEVTFDEFGDKLIELNEGMEGFAELAKKNSAGIATSMQNIKAAMENFGRASINTVNQVLEKLGMADIAGQLDRIKAIIYKASAGFQPILEDWANNILTLSPAFRGLIRNFGAFAASIVGLKVGVPILADISTSAQTLPMAIDLVKKSFNGMKQGMFSVIESVEKFSLSSITLKGALGKLGVAGKNSMVVFSNAILTGLRLIAPTAIIGALVVGVGLVDKYLGGAVSGWLTTAQSKGGEIISKFTRGIVSRIPELASRGADLISEFANAVSANMPFILDAGVGIIFALVDGITENIDSLINSAVLVISSFAFGILERIPDIAVKGLEIVVALAKGIAKNLPTIAVKAGEAIGTFAANITKNLPDILSVGMDILFALIEGIAVTIINLPVIALEIVTSLIEGLTSNSDKVGNEGENLGKKFVEGISRTWENIKRAGVEAMFNFVLGILNGVNNLLGGALDELISKIETAYSVVKSTSKQSGDEVSSAMGGMSLNIKKAADTSEVALNSLGGTMKSALSGTEAIGAQAGEGLASGLRSKVKAVAAAASALAGAATSRMTRVLQIQSPSRVTMAIGQYTGEGLAIGIESRLDAVKSATDAISAAATPSVQRVGEMPVNSGKTWAEGIPANINLNIGGRVYSAFVEDITNAQNAVVDLQMSFA